MNVRVHISYYLGLVDGGKDARRLDHRGRAVLGPRDVRGVAAAVNTRGYVIHMYASFYLSKSIQPFLAQGMSAGLRLQVNTRG